jgi:hypothetical protein
MRRIPVLKAENTAAGIRHADHVAPSNPQKLTLTSPTIGSRSVGIVRSRTKATDFFFCMSRMVTENEEFHLDSGGF